MIAFAGYLAIFVALGASLAVTVQGARYSKSGDASKLRTPVLVLLGSAGLAFLLLEIGILRYDFSIAYIANNTSTTTPYLFLFAAAWAALEGSIVLWGLVLAVFIYLVWRQVGDKDGLGVLALSIMGGIAIFWFGLMATAGNPFAVCTNAASIGCSDSSWWPFVQAVAPLDGRGPNPLLQNHFMMAVHPPLLYIGFVGFTVPFGFAIAALIRRDFGRAWLDRTHRWSLIAWVFLTGGILIGGWWSYEVLGWGGFWAWDPVENSSFLPWLLATAFIHSAIVQRRRGMLQAWNFILVIATFAFTILGTFITRSGVIASVHAFSQSVVGPALLGLLSVVVIGSLGLFVWRSSEIAQAPRLDSLSSREGYILANNLLLTVFTFTVLFGTMYPMLVEAASGDQVAVGRPFFDRASIPIALLLLLILGIGSVSPWRVATPKVLWERLRLATVVGLISGALAVAVWGIDSNAVIATIVLTFFVLTAIINRFISVVRARPESAPKAATKVLRNEPGYWGGQIAHIGIALMAISIATTGGLAVRDTVALTQGETAVVGGYCLRYVEPVSRVEPNRTVSGVIVEVMDESCTNVKDVLEPRVNTYPGAVQPIGTPAVAEGLVNDVYLAIAGGSAERIELNVFVFPLQGLVWFGGFVVILGGLFAMVPKPNRQHRTSKDEETLETAVEAGESDD
ncbi:Cytochrome c heme lyase subunit CcmF [hydrothermal vent metagenome]|uniref:Cytochrome c heme lyase subunit CcmF n=1 Tax=hydrothermal vent metagenome TaxID=652676 RepID=A0A3B0RMQ1_9ZZZZ